MRIYLQTPDAFPSLCRTWSGTPGNTCVWIR